MVETSFFAVFTFFIFFIGFFGILINKRSIIIVLLSIEIILLGINLNFALFSVFLDDFIGQVFALFILTVAASESAICLAIIVSYHRVHGSLTTSTTTLLQG